jgi:hypothetical protein
MAMGAHLNAHGIERIASLLLEMNSSGIRKYDIRMIERSLEVKG